jgi:hypothetical protein
MTTLEMLGEAIRRKKGVINRVDQELDSFIKVVNLFFLHKTHFLFSYHHLKS